MIPLIGCTRQGGDCGKRNGFIFFQHHRTRSIVSRERIRYDIRTVCILVRCYLPAINRTILNHNPYTGQFCARFKLQNRKRNLPFHTISIILANSFCIRALIEIYISISHVVHPIFFVFCRVFRIGMDHLQVIDWGNDFIHRHFCHDI